jgi:hypothetical protein
MDMMEVYWNDPDGQPQQAKAFLRDRSPSGVRLHLHEPLPVGAEIHWYRSRVQQSFWGRVRYCFPTESGYSVGVELDLDCKVSEDRIMRHENLSAGQNVQARIKSNDPWSNWTVISADERSVTLRAKTLQLVTVRVETTQFTGFRQPDGCLEDAQGRRIELRQLAVQQYQPQPKLR